MLLYLKQRKKFGDSFNFQNPVKILLLQKTIKKFLPSSYFTATASARETTIWLQFLFSLNTSGFP